MIRVDYRPEGCLGTRKFAVLHTEANALRFAVATGCVVLAFQEEETQTRPMKICALTGGLPYYEVDEDAEWKMRREEVAKRLRAAISRGPTNAQLLKEALAVLEEAK